MRVSSIAVGFIAAGIVFGASGCRVSVETKQRFVLDSGDSTQKADTQDWNGEPIDIQIQGVGISVNGGVKVIADASATKVTASARFLAMAFEKPDADASIAEVASSFVLSRDNGTIKVVCDHGQTHGSSDSGSSGCEYVEVHVPTGGAGQLLSVNTLSGNGTLTLQLSTAVISSITGNSNGGEIVADLPATEGGTISLVSEKDDITANLPSNFAADEVILAADPASIDLGPFTDIKNGNGAGGRGTAGTGLKLLHLTSKEFAGSTGKITLQ